MHAYTHQNDFCTFIHNVVFDLRYDLLLLFGLSLAPATASVLGHRCVLLSWFLLYTNRYNISGSRGNGCGARPKTSDLCLCSFCMFVPLKLTTSKCAISSVGFWAQRRCRCSKHRPLFDFLNCRWHRIGCARPTLKSLGIRAECASRTINYFRHKIMNTGWTTWQKKPVDSCLKKCSILIEHKPMESFLGYISKNS